MFLVILKQIGRGLWRCLCAIGRFFQFLFKRIAKALRTRRLKKKIKKNDKDIRRLYHEIGEGYYAAHSQAPEDGLSELCGAVDNDLSAIDGFRGDIDSLKERFIDEKAAAKEKARARRASDKEKARADKERVRRKKAGEDVIDEAPAETEKKPLVITKRDKVEAPAPVIETPAAPAPVVEAPAAPEIMNDPIPEPPDEEAISQPAEAIPAETQVSEE